MDGTFCSRPKILSDVNRFLGFSSRKRHSLLWVNEKSFTQKPFEKSGKLGELKLKFVVGTLDGCLVAYYLVIYA